MTKPRQWKRYLTGLSIFISSGVIAETTVLPETPTPVVLSNTDVNRVVCANGTISDAFFSEEKGLTLMRKGSNAFIKFKIKVTGFDAMQHVNKQAEIYIVCNGAVYTLLAQPQKVPAMTIRLSDNTKQRMQSNIDLMNAMPFEEKIHYLTRAAYKDEIPESFSVTPVSKSLSVFKEIDIDLIRQIRVDGVGFRLSEYALKAKSTVDLLETEFLRTEFGTDIAAVTIDPLHLEPGQQARLFIVERVVNQ